MDKQTTNLVLDTLALCSKNLEFVLGDGDNLSSVQTELLSTINQSLQLLVANIYIKSK